MVCSTCGRISAETYCAGCRTLGRIRKLWESKANLPEDSKALSCLRNCAGELADWCEGESGASASFLGVGVAPVDRERAERASGKEKKSKARESGGERTTPPVEVKEEPKSAAGGPLQELDLEEESEESSEAAEDLPVPDSDRRPDIDLRERERERRYNEEPPTRGEPAAPLGLRVLPVRLSAPSQDGGGPGSPPARVEAERSNPPRREPEELPRERRERQARSPNYPPPQREERHRERRERSRTPKGKKKKKKSKGSKGVRKRERGKAWVEEQRSAPHNPQWRRKY